MTAFPLSEKNEVCFIFPVSVSTISRLRKCTSQNFTTRSVYQLNKIHFVQNSVVNLQCALGANSQPGLQMATYRYKEAAAFYLFQAYCHSGTYLVALDLKTMI